MKYGLIGEHLGHSFSKEIHESISDYIYDIHEVAKEDLDTFMKNKDFLGINVTIPYKEKVIPYLDYIDDSAKLIGAVNTIVNKDGKLFGYNTDFLGLRDLIVKSKIDVQNKKVVILGNGGTSKTAKAVLQSLNASNILITALEPINDEISYEELNSKHLDCDVILNATPVGMYPKCDDSLIDVTRFPNLTGVIDVIYNPLKTRLCQTASSNNIKTCNGLYMLVGQAVYASSIFKDKKINPNVIDKVYNKILKQKQNIVLIGMPSCGKSTIGKKLAEKLKKDFIDIDKEIEKEIGTSIQTYIETNGENAFRDLEEEVTKKVSKGNNQVISTGGGVIKRSQNITRLKQNGIICFIDRPLELLKPTASRPLTNDFEKLKKTFEERYNIYMSSADIVVENKEEFVKCADKIYREVK